MVNGGCFDLTEVSVMKLAGTVIERTPPPALVLMAILSIQLGAALAVDLFSVLGPSGAVLSRLAVSVLILAAIFRPKPDGLVLRHWKLLLCYGVTLGLMNWCFYESIARIPLGLAVTIEFMGPLIVATATSHRPVDLLWVAIAVAGLFTLTPEIGANIDPEGVIFAVFAGMGWGGFVLLSKRIGTVFPGADGLVYGMAIATLTMLPFAWQNVLPVFAGIDLFGSVVLLAVLSTAIPFFFEFTALRKLSPHTYGILITLEPVVATVIGMIVLGDSLGAKELIAIACVTTAAFGATLTQKR